MARKTTVEPISIAEASQLLAIEKPWEQLEGEPLIWFTRFQKYLAQPIKPRKIKLIYNEEVGGKNYASPHWHNAAKQYFWVERADMYDGAIAKEVVNKTFQNRVDSGKEIANETEKTFKKFIVVVQEVLNANLSDEAQLDSYRSQLNKISIMTGRGKVLEKLMDGYKAIIGDKSIIETPTNKEVTIEFK